VCAASGAGVAFSGARAGVGGSELPTALALAEVGFLVAERGRSGADLGVALAPSWHGAAASERREEWGTARFRLVGFVEPMPSLPSSARSAYSPFFTPLFTPPHSYAPTAHELQGLHLEWVCAQGGVAAAARLPPELLLEVEQTRKCFFPEKVAWFHDKVRRREKENSKARSRCFFLLASSVLLFSTVES
jgi:hypothetical protein